MTRQPDGDEDVVDVGQYFKVLRDHKLLLVAGLLTGLLLGLLAAQFSGASYTAQAEVVVAPIGGNDPLDTGANVNIATQQQIASSSAVAQSVADELSSDTTPEALLDGLVVSVPNNSNVLAFTYTADDSATAQERAQGFADAYLERRRQQAVDSIADVVGSTESNLADIQGDLLDVGVDLSFASSGSAAERDAEVRQNLLLSQASNLQARLAQLNTLVVEPGTVIQRADTSTSQDGLTRVALVLSLGFLGLLLAAVAAFVRARSDQRTRGADDVQRAARAPVIADLGGPTTAHGREQAGAMLAARLLLAARSSPRRTLALVPVDDTTATAGVVEEVARVMTSQGARVAVVDATGGTVVGGTGVPVVRIRASDGETVQDISEALDRARAGNDVVLVAAHSVLSSAHALLVADESDGVVLVARLGTTRRDGLTDAATGLGETGSRVLGVVLADRPGPRVTSGGPARSGRTPSQPAEGSSFVSADAP